MLDVAKKENSHELIEYMVMDMSEIGCLKQKFDLVSSSFALHYVKDFGKLLDDIRHLLNENGILLFFRSIHTLLLLNVVHHGQRMHRESRYITTLADYM